MILIAASLFSLVFRGFGGDEAVQSLLTALPGGVAVTILVVMLAMFLLGFVLDFIEITYVVVPIVAPVLLALGVNPVWLGVMIAVNLDLEAPIAQFADHLGKTIGTGSQGRKIPRPRGHHFPFETRQGGACI